MGNQKSIVRTMRITQLFGWCGAWLLLGTVSAWGQQPNFGPVYDRNDDCRQCHERLPEPNDFINDIPGKVWDKEDKHRRSFQLLQENEALVTQILGFAMNEVVQQDRISTKPSDRAKVERLKQCLRCHATWPKNDPAWSADKLEPPVELTYGVSCQACHGAGANWSELHRDLVWRLVPPNVKRRFGMTNVRSPVTRALLCASCHVGSLDDGRFVTHEMYAAGHPPLPNFEFVAFSTQMPSHWRPLREKGKFVGLEAKPDVGRFQELHASRGLIHDKDLRSSYLAANFSDAERVHALNDLDKTQATLISGMVVMRDYLKLLQTGFGEGSAPRAPEFALFDCMACHHELRSTPQPKGRPIRLGAPGRPPLQAWQTTLARAGLWQAAKTDAEREALIAEFNRHWQGVERAAKQRPFGDAAAIHKAAGDFVMWLQPQIVQVSTQPFDQSAANRTWEFLTDPKQIAIHDYYDARQTAWSLIAISRESGRDDTAGQLLSPNGQDRLKLKLPAGQGGSIRLDLQHSLKAIAEYDPEWFESVLRELGSK